MAKVTGIGGVFFRASDPEQLFAWYQTHLGIERNAHGIVKFPWRVSDEPEKSGQTVWHLFPKDTAYFGAASPSFMINYIVDDIDGLLEQLKANGAAVDDRRDDSEYGRFAWVTDPDGNRVELWEPPK